MTPRCLAPQLHRLIKLPRNYFYLFFFLFFFFFMVFELRGSQVRLLEEGTGQGAEQIPSAEHQHRDNTSHHDMCFLPYFVPSKGIIDA
jgi:hypothetical protein